MRVEGHSTLASVVVNLAPPHLSQQPRASNKSRHNPCPKSLGPASEVDITARAQLDGMARGVERMHSGSKKHARLGDSNSHAVRPVHQIITMIK